MLVVIVLELLGKKSLFNGPIYWLKIIKNFKKSFICITITFFTHTRTVANYQRPVLLRSCPETWRQHWEKTENWPIGSQSSNKNFKKLRNWTSKCNRNSTACRNQSRSSRRENISRDLINPTPISDVKLMDVEESILQRQL